MLASIGHWGMDSRLRGNDRSNNFLGHFNTAELTYFFKQLPAQLTTLNVSNNTLFVDNIADTSATDILKNLPKYIKSLDLSSNFLGHQPMWRLAAIFKSLLLTINKLNLLNCPPQIDTACYLIWSWQRLPM